MVEISPSRCNEFDKFPSGRTATMLERGAHMVRLYSRPAVDDKSRPKSDADLPSLPAFELAPQIASLLSLKETLDGIPLGFAGSYESLQDASEASFPTLREESDSSHECLYTPAEYPSCSTGSIAAPVPAELKLQEFAQELARLKAQRSRRKYLRKQADIPAHTVLTRREPCPADVHESDESSEENLAYMDASSDGMNDDNGVDSSTGDFQEKDAKSMDFAFLHSVYRTKETHEEAILVRMKYAGGPDRAQEPTSADSALSIRGDRSPPIPQSAFNPELVNTCADMLRETFRKCKRAPSKSTPRSSTSEVESESLAAPLVTAAQKTRSHMESRSASHTSAASSQPPSSPRTQSRTASSGTSLAAVPDTPPPSRLVLSSASLFLRSQSSSESEIAHLKRPVSLRSLPPQQSTASSSRAPSPVPQNASQPYPMSSSESPSPPLSSQPATATPFESDKSDAGDYSPSEYVTDEEGAFRSLQDQQYHTGISSQDEQYHRSTSLHNSMSAQDQRYHNSITSNMPITVDGRVVHPEVFLAEDASFNEYAESSASETTLFQGLYDKLRSFAEGCGLHFIEGKDPPKNPSNALGDSERMPEELNAALLSRLSCVKCGAFCTPPLAFCVWGHVVCERCRPVCLWEDSSCWCRARCPQCSAEMQRKPCALWGYIARSLVYPCRYWAYGCTEIGDLSCEEKLLHEAKCPCRQQRCWANGCEWQGVWHQLRAHVLHFHQADAIRADWYRFVCVCRPRCGRSANIIALPPDELVLLHSFPVFGEQRYLLQYLTGEPRAGGINLRPRFRLRILSADGQSELEVRGEAVTGHHDIEMALRSGKCFRMAEKPFGVSPSETDASHSETGRVQLCLEKGHPSVCR